MAADGLTNNQIAQALFLTPRTVEMHLTSTYRKLSIGSRAQLPNALQAMRPLLRMAPDGLVASGTVRSDMRHVEAVTAS